MREAKKRFRGNVGKRKTSKMPRKVPWTKEERKLLWKCVIRASGKGSDGYISKIVKLWDESGISRRTQTRLISQNNVIENGDLSKLEMEEIEHKVKKELRKNEGDADFVVEFLNFYESDSEDEKGFVGFDS